jgi:hypothetical protein
MDFRLRPSLSFHLGLDDLDGENNGNDHEGNHGNHEQEDENFRVEEVQKDFDANANETHCRYYVNDIADTFENNVEDVAFEDLTNSRMNNMAIRVDQQQSLQVDHAHTTSRFLSLLKISSTKVRKGNHPYIDYIKSFIMTSKKYILALEEKRQAKI